MANHKSTVWVVREVMRYGLTEAAILLPSRRGKSGWLSNSWPGGVLPSKGGMSVVRVFNRTQEPVVWLFLWKQMELEYFGVKSRGKSLGCHALGRT